MELDGDHPVLVRPDLYRLHQFHAASGEWTASSTLSVADNGLERAIAYLDADSTHRKFAASRSRIPESHLASPKIVVFLIFLGRFAVYPLSP